MWHRSCRPFGGLPSELLFSRLLAGLWRGRWCSELSTLSCGLSGGPLVTLRCHCRLLLLDGWSRKGASQRLATGDHSDGKTAAAVEPTCYISEHWRECGCGTGSLHRIFLSVSR